MKCLLLFLWALTSFSAVSGQECDTDGQCDTHERCPVWKEQGECLRNFHYMEEHCKVSCRNVERDLKGECKNLHERCSVWAELGECKHPDSKSSMKLYCPQACGFCKGEDEEEEKDEEDEFLKYCFDNHKNCAFWASAGECDKNPRYMESNCAKSCQTCEKIRPEIMQRIEQANNRGGDNVVIDEDVLDKTEKVGVRQKVEGSQSAETMKLIQETLAYMESDEVASVDKEIHANCQNRHELCSYWALIGECENNRAYMVTQCAVACKSCVLIDLDTRCPPLEDPYTALEPGDLNKMFEHIVETAPGNRTLTEQEKKELADDLMPEYSVVVHSRPSENPATTVDLVLDKALPPWVITFENFVTEEECQEMINLGYKYVYKRSEDVGEQKFDGSFDSVQSQRRTSENAWCSDHHGCRAEEMPQRLHNRVAKVMNIPPENSEDFQLLKYEEGQFYRTHHDYIEHQADRHCGPRILTFFLYLSDVEAGGGTNFPELDITVMPKRGRALLWPSVLDSEPYKKDGRMMHQALTVEKGTKFAANGWIHQHDYITPQKAGCN